MDISSLSKTDRIRVQSKLHDLQMEQTFQAINNSVEVCFDACITSFRDKSLNGGEQDCLKTCAGKFLSYSQRVGERMTEKMSGQ